MNENCMVFRRVKCALLLPYEGKSAQVKQLLNSSTDNKNNYKPKHKVQVCNHYREICTTTKFCV